MSNWLGKNYTAELIVAFLIVGGWASGAHAMSELEDGALATVSARGVAFNLEGVTLQGDLSITYVGEGGEHLRLSDIAVSQNHAPDSLFSDPYRLELDQRGEGAPEAIRFYTPSNVAGNQGWNFAADISIFDGATVHAGGALVVNDLQTRGNTLSLTSPGAGGDRTIMFGNTIDVDVAAVAIRPAGRDTSLREFRIEGFHLGGRDGGAWEISDIDKQPVVLNAGADGSLYLELLWPQGRMAPLGSVQIDRLGVYGLSGPGSLSLVPGVPGAGVSLGSVQLQYLNLRLKP